MRKRRKAAESMSGLFKPSNLCRKMTGRGSNLCFDLVNKISDWKNHHYRADSVASGPYVCPLLELSAPVANFKVVASPCRSVGVELRGNE